jgi:hypothetical protein
VVEVSYTARPCGRKEEVMGDIGHNRLPLTAKQEAERAEERRYRAMNFAERKAYRVARLPRVRRGK